MCSSLEDIYAGNYRRSTNVLLFVFGICLFARNPLPRGQEEGSYWQKQLHLLFWYYLVHLSLDCIDFTFF